MKIYRMNKVMLIIGAAFAAFAVIIAIAGTVIMLNWINFSKTCVSTEAVITDIYRTGSGDDEYYHVVVEYMADGEIYSGQLGYYSSSLKIGRTVTVYYDPEDPNITMNRPYIACALIAVFVLIFGGIGFGMLIAEFCNRKIINRLAEEDKYIILDTQAERREVSANMRVNNVYYVQTDFVYYDQQGKEYIFSSRPYPPGKCPFDPWQSVKVYVDMEKNPKKYYVYSDNEYFSGEKELYSDDYLKH